MSKIKSDILIIGGGLTGLTIAYLLRKENRSVHIIEARERLGGRINTKYKDGFAPQEMGATWLGKKHTELTALLTELNIDIFEQILGDRAIYEPISTSPPQLVTLPPNSDPSYRVSGGSSQLINTLASHLNSDHIFTSEVVASIYATDDFLTVKSTTQEFEAAIVISTLPPYLLTQSITVQPSLPTSLTDISNQTHTWMGESIKVSLTFEKPFWRTHKSSGTIFSNVGPIPEMYDHSDEVDGTYALKGFFNGAYFSISKEERLALVIKQLQKYFGNEITNFITYEETVWRNEPFTFTPYQSHVLPHQNNGHPIYQQSYIDGKFWIAGSETATNFPGYMEGAIQSAQFICKQLQLNI